MPKVERMREAWSGPLTPEQLEQKARAGWKLAAVEWVREAEGEEKEAPLLREHVPFGLQVAGDCVHLEENRAEREALLMMMERIVEDQPLSQVASELNRQGFRTRHGSPWSPVSVFEMLPRLIQVGPQVFIHEQWAARRSRILNAVRG